VPTLMRRIAETVHAGERLDSVRIAHLAGEPIEWSDLETCSRTFAHDVFLYANLGSTECGIYLHWFINREISNPATRPPAGRPSPDYKVTIVTDDGTAVTQGEIGEIVVSSRFMAPGNWDGLDLQVHPFPSDPTDPKVRVLHTGDLGRRRL